MTDISCTETINFLFPLTLFALTTHFAQSAEKLCIIKNNKTTFNYNKHQKIKKPYYYHINKPHYINNNILYTRKMSSPMGLGRCRK
jgi:hypothetical protein